MYVLSWQSEEKAHCGVNRVLRCGSVQSGTENSFVFVYRVKVYIRFWTLDPVTFLFDSPGARFSYVTLRIRDEMKYGRFINCRRPEGTNPDGNRFPPWINKH